MIDRERWETAQAAERTYWYPDDWSVMAARRSEETARLAWIAELLGITPRAVEWRSVMDIGGGPQPLVGWPALPLSQRIVLDPLPVSGEDLAQMRSVTRIAVPAEEYTGPRVDECWGYNVLQHVMSPELVLRIAMLHAQTVRWFEWVDQPTSVVHPHVVTHATFAPLDAWHRVAWTEGVRDEGRGWAQAYVAGVWERPR